MNERRREEDSFLIENLDETHLLIKADLQESMRAELEAEVRDLGFIKRAVSETIG
jgi:Transcription factor TFIIH complex subunit Tfb5